MTKFIGLIGYPLKHSLSPYFQQAALDYHQLDIHYEIWETAPEKLKTVVEGLRQPQNLGANVTVPYKEIVLSLVDELNNLASLIGAVNTIIKRDNKLVGFNTDAYGFLQALRQEGKFMPGSKKVVVLGAGGAARAVSFSLLREGAGSITIANRSFERAQKLAVTLRQYAAQTSLKAQVNALPWQDLRGSEALRHCHLIVNCTTLGMKHTPDEKRSPLTPNLIPKDALVYDLVYNPPQTLLLRLAREVGAQTLSGLSMLIYQGAASFKLWTGREAPVDIMFKSVKQVLNEPQDGGE